MRVIRPSWDRYALELARVASIRSEDPYVQVGSVVLRPDHSVAGLGYNGAPPGIDIDWSDREARRPAVIHAEANALRWAWPSEVAGGLLASTHMPCQTCLPVIASYGIKRVIFSNLLSKSGTEIDQRYDFDVAGQVARQLGLRFEHYSTTTGG